ncbi:MAG: AmmeMemoRadiSam system radical SAM enzyme [Acidobacteria bacterium]|nr:AmmeMemoRadiSam system radical SAM enzyme [Acidobacteriota bacterium]
MESAIDRYRVPKTELAKPHRSGKIECVACAHRCKLAEGKRGVCLVRSRSGDELLVPWGYTAGMAADPIEKKPFFHVMPGSEALSFGMLGCDMRCEYCQNWFTSQTLRDPAASQSVRPVTARELVRAAVARGCRSVVSTYNEPLITAEWAHEIFSLAKEEGLVTGFVSNGHATPEVLDYLRPVTDIYKVDLKSFREEAYRGLGGRLAAVLETIRGLVDRGFWVEVVTLVVPGFNDTPRELREIASFLAGVSRDIPWHVTAFHPDYRMADRGPTPASTLAAARETGFEAGLSFVYAGNLPGRVPHAEDTLCPSCGKVLVERWGFRVLSNLLSGSGGRCPGCGAEIPGRWK